MGTITGLIVGGVSVAAIGGYAYYSKKKGMEGQIAGMQKEIHDLQDEIKNMRRETSSSISTQKKKTLSKETLFHAKKAFLSNIDSFSKYLLGLEINDYDEHGLSEAIITLNDSALIEWWQFYHRDNNEIVNSIANWGISYNNAASFVCNDQSNMYYSTESGIPLEIGHRYKVKKAYWIKTAFDNDKQEIIQDILVKGLVSE